MFDCKVNHYNICKGKLHNFKGKRNRSNEFECSKCEKYRNEPSVCVREWAEENDAGPKI